MPPPPRQRISHPTRLQSRQLEVGYFEGFFSGREFELVMEKRVGFNHKSAVVADESETNTNDENRWAEDPSHTKFVHSHLRGLAPAGRLDIDSTGLIVFTQDGSAGCDMGQHALDLGEVSGFPGDRVVGGELTPVAQAGVAICCGRPSRAAMEA